MRPLDWAIIAVTVVGFTAACVIWQQRQDVKHWRRLYSQERREHAVTLGYLDDAEAIINAPCIGCGEIPVTAQAAQAEVQRIEAGSETPLFDGLLVRDLYADMEAFERGETA